MQGDNFLVKIKIKKGDLRAYGVENETTAAGGEEINIPLVYSYSNLSSGQMQVPVILQVQRRQNWNL